ncbi:hypothetical protein VNI00_006431 [Paramarasmius palmivorus]|uniref:AB hydrolase-1 domain-containing protein n=1 Tax=Paramarasmius palmivorus TaxID=297713 RepID=A0AAW0DA68_9AGAR
MVAERSYSSTAFQAHLTTGIIKYAPSSCIDVLVDDIAFQVTYFEERGYGLIVPDMLGYGGTSKPTDIPAYRYSLIAADLKDILDAEKVQKVVAFGHDWGVMAAARLVAYHPERVEALGLLTVGYIPPPPPGTNFSLEECNERTKKAYGYEVVGYWEFFSAPDAGTIIMANLETALNLVFPADYELWKTDVAPLGALRASFSSGEAYPPAPWLSTEDREQVMANFKKSGFDASTCYYKLQTSGTQFEDDQQLPPEKALLPKIPIFFGDALKDHIAREELFLCAFGLPESPLQGENVTRKAFNAGHWVMYEKPDELSEELNNWLKGF